MMGGDYFNLFPMLKMLYYKAKSYAIDFCFG